MNDTFVVVCIYKKKPFQQVIVIRSFNSLALQINPSFEDIVNVSTFGLHNLDIYLFDKKYFKEDIY